jgi:hypothetical protein
VKYRARSCADALPGLKDRCAWIRRSEEDTGYKHDAMRILMRTSDEIGLQKGFPQLCGNDDWLEHGFLPIVVAGEGLPFLRKETVMTGFGVPCPFIGSHRSTKAWRID